MQHKRKDTELIYGDHKKKKANLIVKAQKQENWYRTMPFNHQTLFTRTKVMKDNPFDIEYKIVADHNFIVSMYQQGKRFHYLDRTVAVFAEGGFANSNTVKMCIESLKVLIEKGVSLDDIYLTSWYKYLYTTEQAYHTLQTKHSNDIDLLEHRFSILQNQYETLMESLSDIAKIRIWKHPVKKFQAYKKLLSLYHQQKTKS